MIQNQTVESEHFGSWLKQQRTARGLSHQQLADKVDCARVTIRMIESGTRKPSPQIASLLAGVFGVPPDERDAFIAYSRHSGALPAKGDGTGDESEEALISPWRAMHARLTNLPVARTGLIAREEEIAEIQKRLLGSRHRLITITGPPGVGKTRLASALAGTPEMQERFVDGVIFVPLLPLSAGATGAQVLGAIAETLGIKESSTVSQADLVRRYVAGRRMLLVLDNYEHIIEAAGAVASLLEAGPWLKVLVTSREALSVRGERVFVLAPLAIPENRPSPMSPAQLRDLGSYPAIELFVERAMDTDPQFVLDERNAAPVAELCIRLDGLPLAIELVASLSKTLSPAQMLAQLEEHRPVSGVLRDLPAHQSNLSDAIGWSYKLLSPQEQAIFRKLAVFAGGFDLLDVASLVLDRASEGEGEREGRLRQAVEMLGTSTDELDLVTLSDPDFEQVAACLGALLSKSLIKRTSNEGFARYMLLETIKAYAWEQLEAHEESRRARDDHARFAILLAERAEAGLAEPEQRRWFEVLRREDDNLRAALKWLMDSSDIVGVLRLAGALGLYWFYRGDFGEARLWLSRTLHYREEMGADVDPVILGRASYWHGMILSYRGDLEGGDRELLKGLAVLDGDSSASMAARARLLYARGHIARHRIDLETAEELVSLSAKMRERLGEESSAAMSYFQLSLIAFDRADYEAQEMWLARAETLWRKHNNKHNLVYILEGQTRFALKRKEYARAEHLIDEFQQIYEEWGDKRGIGVAYQHRGELAVLEGKWQAAETWFQRCVKICHLIADDVVLKWCLYRLAGAANALGRWERAAILFGVLMASLQGRPVQQALTPEMLSELSSVLQSAFDEDTFRELVAEGAAMQSGQWVAYALEMRPEQANWYDSEEKFPRAHQLHAGR